ncbi:9440_t:CDS:2, partial [Ambispora leptoticha]
VEKAADAILKYVSSKTKTKQTDDIERKKNLLQQPQSLIPNVETVWLQVATHRFSQLSKNMPVRLPLKHPFYGPDTEICLITKDPQEEFKKLLVEKGIKRINKVIGISKLRTKYKQYEARRILCDSYELFLTDERVIPLLPKLLGKCFFKKKKQPIPVNLKSNNLKNEINRACNSTYLHFTPGNCFSVKIGKTTMSSHQIYENIMEVVPHLVEKMPRKKRNIKSLGVKTGDSVLLPIYNSPLANE